MRYLVGKGDIGTGEMGTWEDDAYIAAPLKEGKERSLAYCSKGYL